MTGPSALRPEDWLKVTPKGLYCVPGDFHIDPASRVERAVVTHGHGDHARPGHRKVLATAETLAIMAARYGDDAGRERQALAYGERLSVNGVDLRLVPAGHVLGSAQVVLEHRGQRIVVSGDYKRRPDATCPPFEVVRCDVFISEATFGLPVFRHPSDDGEIAKVLHALALFPERSVLLGAYALGKCQRVITLLRAAGYDRTIYLHGALQSLCDLYERFGVALGPLAPLPSGKAEALAGAVVLAPPSAIGDRWSRRLPEPIPAFASGWMRVRARARQRSVELPLVISDHADWDELTRTIDEVDAGEVWITHGQEEALVHYATSRGRRARALALVGRDEEDEPELPGLDPA
jgi:putative mRNA 3-end processing factor